MTPDEETIVQLDQTLEKLRNARRALAAFNKRPRPRDRLDEKWAYIEGVKRAAAQLADVCKIADSGCAHVAGAIEDAG